MRLLLLLLFTALAWSETILDSDFATATVPVAWPSDMTRDLGADIQGVLPMGWQEDSAWAASKVRYERLEEEGRAYLAIRPLELAKNARAQIRYPLGDLPAGMCQVAITCRAPQGGRLVVAIKGQGDKTWYGRQDTAVETAWSTETTTVLVDKPLTKAYLYLWIPNRNDVDVLRLTAEFRDLAKWKTELAARYPDGGPRNLLNVSRFPAGPAVGWSLQGGGYADEEFASGPVGPSGFPSLHVRLKGPPTFADSTRLVSAPFAICLPFDRHVVSFAFHGQLTNGRLRVMCDDVKLAACQLPTTSTWTTVELSFTPNPLGRSHYLEFAGDGSFQIDGVKAERGNKATPYTAMLEGELSLTAAAGPAAVARMQFLDEAPAITVVASGLAEGDRLVGETSDVTRAATPLSAVLPAPGADRVTRMDLPLPIPRDRAGSWRVALRAQRGDKDVAPVSEIVIHRVPRPVAWGMDAPDSPFGVHMASSNQHIVGAKAGGINWVRLHNGLSEGTYWFHLEKEQGHWTFDDASMNRYRDGHLSLLGVLCTTPEWASTLKDMDKDDPRRGPKLGGYRHRYFVPADLAAWDTYVSTVTAHYHDQIRVWDAWNEPYWPDFFIDHYDLQDKAARKGWRHPSDPAQAFANLMTRAHQVIKTVDPSLTLLGMSTRHYGEAASEFTPNVALEWTGKLLAAKADEACEVMCYHHYQNPQEALGFPGDKIHEGLRTFDATKTADGHLPKPVWMTEGSSVITTTGSGLYRDLLPWTNREDVAFTSDTLVRYVSTLLAAGNDKVFLYGMQCFNGFGNPRSNVWRTLVCEDGSIHPSMVAMSALTQRLEGRQRAGGWRIGEGIHAFAWTGQGSAVAVIIPQSRHDAWAVPKGASDLWGNPIPAGTVLGRTLVYVTAQDLDHLKQAVPTLLP